MKTSLSVCWDKRVVNTFYSTFFCTWNHELLFSKLTFWNTLEQKTFLPLTFKDTPSTDLFSDHSVSWWSAGTNLSPQFYCVSPHVQYVLGHRLLAQSCKQPAQMRFGLDTVQRPQPAPSPVTQSFKSFTETCIMFAPAQLSNGPFLANISSSVLFNLINVEHISKLLSIHASTWAKLLDICNCVSTHQVNVSVIFSLFLTQICSAPTYLSF